MGYIMIVEDYEEKALEEATCKSHCWFRYIDNIFLIWPHGTDRQTEFLNHLSSLHKNIQFTVDLEDNGISPFWT